MRCRLARVLVLSGLVAALVAIQAAPVASGEEGDERVGYTVGFDFTSNGRLPNCNFYSIELESAEITQVNDTGEPVFCADGLTFDDDGTLYAYRNQSIGGTISTQLITIDPEDGDQRVIGDLPGVVLGSGGMTFDAEGDLWLYGTAPLDRACDPSSGVCLWEVDSEDASSELVGSAPPGVGVFGLTGDCEEVIAITTSTAFGGPTDLSARLDEVDTSDASLESIVDLPGFGFPAGLDFDSDEDLWALGNRRGTRGIGLGPTLFLIDPEDGDTEAEDITFESGAPFEGSLFGLAVDPISCEEPVPPAPPVPAPVVVEPLFTG